MKTKLTLVSVLSNGRRVSRFVTARVIDGKSIVSGTVLAELANDMGLQRGDTMSIGG